MRVGFIVEGGGADWLGGVNYIRNLLQAVLQLPERRIEPVLITGTVGETPILKSFPQLEVLRTPLVDRRTPGWMLRRGLSLLERRDFLLDRLLVRRGIRVLSHSGHLGPGAKTRTVTWIPDFQHRALPQFFDWKERVLRDYHFHGLLRHSSTVLVSSHDAEGDLRKFAPRHRGAVRVLRFASRPPLDGLQITRPELESRYGFRGPYFHLPNQFWIHKNHRVVIEALRRLKRDGVSPLVLATGSEQDYRHPHHFEELRRLIRSANVEENFRRLGVVPYADLIALMRHSVAVLNPSLFEGWSTSVEEAKALGLRVLLSDLPVHREQAPPRGTFFNPHSPEELARQIEALWSDRGEATEAPPMDESATERYRAFGETYQRVVIEAAGSAPV